MERRYSRAAVRAMSYPEWRDLVADSTEVRIDRATEEYIICFPERAFDADGYYTEHVSAPVDVTVKAIQALPRVRSFLQCLQALAQVHQMPGWFMADAAQILKDIE